MKQLFVFYDGIDALPHIVTNIAQVIHADPPPIKECKKTCCCRCNFWKRLCHIFRPGKSEHDKKKG